VPKRASEAAGQFGNTRTLPSNDCSSISAIAEVPPKLPSI